MLKALTPRDAWKLLEEGKARLFDIREPDEIEAVRAVHAEAAPLSIAGYMNLPPLAPGTVAILTCHSGRRVAEHEAAIRPLAAGGQAYALAGGMEAWLKEGLPVKRGHRLSIE
ncbi:MAG: rhodanese, partial [Desulfovibrio sp.]|nr:rhodanese [Desulfovibrio sp.]